jgi:arylamine N-acetyltransferase
MDLEAYLRRIEYDGPRHPSASTLRSLHRQHLFTVPFENLDIPLKIPIRLELPLLYDKIVVRRRGGFCYELNGLFCELLTAMGFQVCMLSARVRRDHGGFGPEFDHMLLKVQLDEPWLVDVGFGESFVDPIIFHAGGADQVNGYRYLVSASDDEWHFPTGLVLATHFGGLKPGAFTPAKGTLFARARLPPMSHQKICLQPGGLRVEFWLGCQIQDKVLQDKPFAGRIGAES